MGRAPKVSMSNNGVIHCRAFYGRTSRRSRHLWWNLFVPLVRSGVEGIKGYSLTVVAAIAAFAAAFVYVMCLSSSKSLVLHWLRRERKVACFDCDSQSERRPPRPEKSFQKVQKFPKIEKSVS